MTSPTHSPSNISSFAATLVLAACAIALVTGIVAYPEQAFHASLQGLTIWWDIVFPAMLPFLILSEIMIAFGIMHFLGIWLEPVMRLVLRLPGKGGWALSMAVTSGYPAGARSTAVMRERNWITRDEGERLLAYSYLCSPVFVVSVVAVGFFRNASLGWLLLGLHLASWFICLMVFRFILWRRPFNGTSNQTASQDLDKTARRSIRVMVDARREDGRSFGKLMGDAVTTSIQTMLMIGGFMMLFSVIIQISNVSGVIPLISQALQRFCYVIGIPGNIIQPMLAGLVEIHLGAHGTSSSNIPPAWQAAAAGAVLAWGGWSAHAQVKSITTRTDLSLMPYLQFRLLHSAVAFLLTLLLWKPLLYKFGAVQPSLSSNGADPVVNLSPPNLWLTWPNALLWGGCTMLLLGFASIVMRLFAFKQR